MTGRTPPSDVSPDSGSARKPRRRKPTKAEIEARLAAAEDALCRFNGEATTTAPARITVIIYAP